MLKIGLIDRYLDNWHANYYPGFLRDAAKEMGLDADITHVWAEMDAPGGMTNEEWCRMIGGVTLVDSYAELIASCDVLMFLCADDVYPHERLADLALRSGKRLYCDKTFAPDTASARRMFQLAKQCGTPLFTSSAMRFCPDLTRYCEDARLAGKKAAFAASTGPGEIVNYSVHQLEMIERVMGTGAVDCMAFAVHDSKTLVYRYPGGRRATVVQSPNAIFSLVVSDDYAHWDTPNKPTNRAISPVDYYMPFMKALLTFYLTGELPLQPADTMEIMAMQEAARAAVATPETWVPLVDRRL